MAMQTLPLGVRSNPEKTNDDGAAVLVNCYAEDAGEEGKVRYPIYARDIGTGVKTISNAADSSTNFGKYFALNLNGTTVYVPCGTVAPT